MTPTGPIPAPGSAQAAPASGGDAAVGYRPHLDGLRAIAVYLVVAFHTDLYRLGGGFIGVDVFFVLSGYLVTQLLLRDVGTHGSVRLARFYARRVRRLLPAAAVVLVSTAAVYVQIASPAEWSAARDGIRAAALYFANWFFISRSDDYFGADIESNPVLHFWSLSVEEQFYVVWPLALLALHRLARRTARPRRTMQVVVVAAGAASAVAALVLSASDLDRAYFGTDTRAYQLLAGALLALTPGAARRIGARLTVRAGSLLTVAGLGALVLSASWLVELGAVQRGVLAAVVTVVVLLLLESGRGGAGARLLSGRTVVYLGRISYGTYLWHWLVVLVLASRFELGNAATVVATVVVSTALAALSFELVEQPVRSAGRLDRVPRVVVAAGLAASVAVGVALVPAVFDRSDPPVAVADQQSTARTASSDAADVDWRSAQRDIPQATTCDPSTPERCLVEDGGGASILLIGDSHARMLIPMFAAVARSDDLSLYASVLPVCPWVDGIGYGNSPPECADAQSDWFGELLEVVDPSVVVLAHRAIDDPASPVAIVEDGARTLLEPFTDEFASVLDARVTAAVSRLRGSDRRVVIVEPLPITAPELDPLTCLARGRIEPCRFVANQRPLSQELVFRRLADEDDGVFSLDLDQASCPYLPICDPVIDDVVVRRDNTHITATFARAIAPSVARWLRDNDVVP